MGGDGPGRREKEAGWACFWALPICMTWDADRDPAEPSRVDLRNRVFLTMTNLSLPFLFPSAGSRLASRKKQERIFCTTALRNCFWYLSSLF